MNNSNEDRERERRIQKEKQNEKKGHRNKNEDEDEMVFFILEEMFPGYAREYHENQYLLQLHQQDSTDNHVKAQHQISQLNPLAHQSTNVLVHGTSYQHVTATNHTNDYTVNLSFHSLEENHFFPSGQTYPNPPVQSVSSSNQQQFDIPFEVDCSVIEFPKHEIMPHTDFHICHPQAIMGKT